MDAKTAIQMQMAEIDRLRAELAALQAENRRLLDWIAGDGPDALTTLQMTYSDPKADKASLIKAAIGALPYERSKPASVSVVIDWKEKTRSIRLRQLERDRARWAAEADAAKLIEAKPVTAGEEPDPPAA